MKPEAEAARLGSNISTAKEHELARARCSSFALPQPQLVVARGERSFFIDSEWTGIPAELGDVCRGAAPGTKGDLVSR